MDISIKRIPKSKKRLLDRLMQLYLYDMSEIAEIDIGEDAQFHYRQLDSYWTDPARAPFLILVDECIAGFVLVNAYTCAPGIGDAKSIAEFLILRKYRRKGVGRAAACAVFDRFPGKWEVRQIPENVVGQRFWRSIINEYTTGDFEEVWIDNHLWKGPAQIFDNSRGSEFPP